MVPRRPHARRSRRARSCAELAPAQAPAGSSLDELARRSRIESPQFPFGSSEAETLAGFARFWRTTPPIALNVTKNANERICTGSTLIKPGCAVPRIGQHALMTCAINLRKKAHRRPHGLAAALRALPPLVRGNADHSNPDCRQSGRAIVHENIVVVGSVRIAATIVPAWHNLPMWHRGEGRCRAFVTLSRYPTIQLCDGKVKFLTAQ